MSSVETQTNNEPTETPGWVSESNGNVPDGAIRAGKINDEKTYVARVKYDGKWVPGQLIPSKKKCVFLFDGDVFSKTKYEVLCNCTASWSEMTDESSIPRRALYVDGNEPAGTQSFIGRVVIDEDVFLGEVVESDELLYISHNDIIQSLDHYEILVILSHEILAIDEQNCDIESEVKKKQGKSSKDRKSQRTRHRSSEVDSDNIDSDVTESDEEKCKKKTRKHSRQSKRRSSSDSESSERDSRQYSQRRKKHSRQRKYRSSSDSESGEKNSRYYSQRQHKHVPRRNQSSESEEEPVRIFVSNSSSDESDHCSTKKATWVKAKDGYYPRNALAGGKNHLGKVYVARAYHNGAVLPGKLIPTYKYCYISLNGEEIRKRKYEVLCNLTGEDWVPMTSNDPVPRNAVPGGHNQNEDEVFIGRVLTNKSYTIGRIEELNGKYRCLILLKKEEEVHKTFEILTQKKHRSSYNSEVGFWSKVKQNVIKKSDSFSSHFIPKLTTQQGSWKEAENGAVPAGGVIGGCNEQGDVFVARGVHEGSILPGKLLPSKGYFYTCCTDGKEVRLKNYEVLCNCDAHWQRINIQNGDVIPKTAIPGGVLSTGETLYIARVRHRKGNGITCGMVDKTSSICTVVYGREGHEYQEYEILVLSSSGSPHPHSSTARLGKQIAATRKSGASYNKKIPSVTDIKQGLKQIDLKSSDPEYIRVAQLMKNTIRTHGGNIGGVFSKYNISKIAKIEHPLLKKRYNHYADVIKSENGNDLNEKPLFHGSPNWKQILENGFDERKSTINGMFGAGIYFAEHSSKSNQYVFGFSQGNICPQHKTSSCYTCDRHLILCNVALGKTSPQQGAFKVPHAPPGHHSVTGVAGANLKYVEYINCIPRRAGSRNTFNHI